MRAEYLLFDLVVLAGPAALSLLPRARFARPARALAWALLAVVPWFLLWDAAVVDRHWWFDPRYVLGPSVFGLPLEEVAFFVVVPFGCVFAWETILHGSTARPRPPTGPAGRRLAFATLALLGVAAVVAAAAGREYTALSCAAVAVVVLLDDALGTALWRTPRAWGFAGLVTALTAVFNGYLTARPVVHYDPAYQLGVRLGTIPIEDFAYGLALTGAILVVHQWHLARTPAPSWLGRAVAWRLGGYRQRVHAPDPDRPDHVAARVGAENETSAVVVGGGLAGLSAAVMLAERGVQVTVLERQGHLGGKIGAWTERLADGRDAPIEHGFHAFFGHYYNLDAWLTELGLDPAFAPVDDYVILTRDGRRLGFGTQRRAPVTNLLALGRQGLYRFREVMRRRTADRLRPMLGYDPERTYAELDATSFADYAAAADLPADLRLVFNAFARAFFASHDRLSTAELVRSFHFYYLGHDHGLGYRYLDGAYARDLLTPIEARARALGVRFRRNVEMTRIDRRDAGLVVAGSTYDHVVLATDVRAARRILLASPDVAEHDPSLVEAVGHLHAGQRYAVLRVWTDRPSPTDLPVFVATERDAALDAVTFVDRIDPTAAEDGGGVLELHCYAVDDDMPDHAVRDAMLAELRARVPALADVVVRREHLQVRDDFTAFHTGQHAHRPGPVTTVPGLVLAGDWVRLPVPAMLMEAAHTSARYAVNAICDRLQVRTFPIDTVPTRGLLARPAEAKLGPARGSGRPTARPLRTAGRTRPAA